MIRKCFQNALINFPFHILACGDKRAYCTFSLFNAAKDCTPGHRVNCPRTCGVCSTNQDKCVNLQDRATNCGSRNCLASNIVERHRAHVKCARTCCKREQLF